MKKALFFLLFFFMSCSLVFSQTIEITEPKANDIFKAASAMDLAWTASGITGNLKISLVPAAGGTMTTLVPSTSPNSSPLQVDIPQNISPDTYRLRISSQSNPSIFNVSGDFYINAHNSGLNVSRPNSYSRFTWGMREEIKWVRVGIANDLKCSLALFKGNNLKGWIAQRVGGTSYMWTVPSVTTGTDYRIKVYLDPGSSGGLSPIGLIPDVLSRSSQNFRIAASIADLVTYSMKIENPNPNENTNLIKFSAAIENLSPVLGAYPTRALLKIKQGSFSTSRILEVPDFKKKEMKTIKTTYPLPRSGNYTHTLILNYDQAIPEADTTNNTTTKNVQIKLLPDLLLYVQISDRTPRIFKKTHFEIDVKNIGKEASEPVNMSFSLKGKDTNNYTIPALRPKQKFHIKRSAKYGTKGSRSYRIRVDTLNAQAETTKANNEKTGSIRVLLPTDFDSAGLDLCDIEPVIVASGKAKRNQFYPITVKVRQLGTRKSSPSIIRYRVPDENIQKDYGLPEILPGETYTAVYRIKWTSAGAKRFEVHVDPNQSIKGERHVNNKTEKSITVMH